MSVKSIFKTLIGTIFIIVMTSVVLEMYNVSTTSAMINQYLKLSAEQSCVLFTQETYRTSGTTATAGAINQGTVLAFDGTDYSYTTSQLNYGATDGVTATSGSEQAVAPYNMNQFYNQFTKEEIWKALYDGNTSFQSEMKKVIAETKSATGISDDTEFAKVFPEVDALRIMSETSAGTAVSVVRPTGNLWDLDESSPELIRYNNQSRANTFKNNMYTPVNVGIPYIDKDVVNRIFQWQLTQLFSNSNSNSIQCDEGDEGKHGCLDYYVNFRGFKIYTKAAQITNFTYHVCDLSKQSGKDELYEKTGISADGLNLKTESGIITQTTNNLVFLVEIDYKVPVEYRGITPLKNIITYTMNNKVAGYNNADTTPNFTYDDSKSIGIGGSAAAAGSKLSTGKLYYTLVR